jgi:hypothetical protein
MYGMISRCQLAKSSTDWLKSRKPLDWWLTCIYWAVSQPYKPADLLGSLLASWFILKIMKSFWQFWSRWNKKNQKCSSGMDSHCDLVGVIGVNVSVIMWTIARQSHGCAKSRYKASVRNLRLSNHKPPGECVKEKCSFFSMGTLNPWDRCARSQINYLVEKRALEFFILI